MTAAVTVLLGGFQAAQADTLEWTIKSKYPCEVYLAFCSQDRTHFWPDAGKAWILKGSKFYTYRLNYRRARGSATAQG